MMCIAVAAASGSHAWGATTVVSHAWGTAITFREEEEIFIGRGGGEGED
jgi:hypothetical protein